MQKRAQAICFGILVSLCACKHGPEKSLAGDWLAEGNSAKASLRLAQDGSAYIVVGNQFAAGVLVGTYHQTSNTLVLKLSSLQREQATENAFRFEWKGANRIELKSDRSGELSGTYTRSGPIPASAALPGSSPADIDKAREAATKVACLSNVKQLGLAALTYAADYDQTFPAYDWANATLPYVKRTEIYTCPVLVKENRKGGYAMDSRLLGAKLASVLQPQSNVLIFESSTETIGSADPQTSLLTKSRHSSGINVAYVDGHAKSILPR